MPVRDIYSKRQKRLSGDVPDIYIYDDFPEKFRIQLVHIIKDCLGNAGEYRTTERMVAYNSICNILHREYGVFRLSEKPRYSDQELFEFIVTTKESENILDVIEVSFSVISFFNKSVNYKKNNEVRLDTADAIIDLNTRLMENAIGFQFESGKIIRMDSKYIHQEIMKPALLVLSGADYEGANKEFLSAHEHYRNGDYKECLIDCLKSFESTMKIICTKHEWEFNSEKDTATKLIEICFQHK